MLTSNTTRLMKNPSVLLALAGLTLGSAAAVAQSVTTDPVGFTTLTIKGSSFNVLGLNMVKPVTYQGVVSGVNGAQVTDANADFTAALTAGKKYFVEIISGDYAGLNAEVVSWSGNTITIAGDVSGIAGALTGAGHRIRESWTIADVFGASNSAGLRASDSPIGADKIYVSNPTTGAFEVFYYQQGNIFDGDGWRSTASSQVDRSGTAIYFTDGLIVERTLGSDLAVKLVGAVKTGRTIVGVQNGFNLIGNVYPVSDLTLANSGLYGSAGLSLSGSDSAVTSDQVLVAAPGGFAGYYYQVGSLFDGDGWRSTGNSSVDAGGTSIPIGSGLFLLRRGAATSVVLTPTF